MEIDFTIPLFRVEEIPQILFQSYVHTYDEELAISPKPPLNQGIYKELREIKRQLKINCPHSLRQLFSS